MLRSSCSLSSFGAIGIGILLLSAPSYAQAVNPVPTLTAVSPNTAPVGSADLSVLLVGTGFVQASVVHFSGDPLATRFISASQLSALIPEGKLAAAGSFSLTVMNPPPGGGTSNPQTFTAVAAANPIPTLMSVDPVSAIAGAAITMTLSGSGFIAASVARLDGLDLPTTYVNETRLIASIAAARLTVGSHSVTVFNPPPGGSTSRPLTFNVFPSALPVITFISPVVSTQGTMVEATIIGTNLLGATSISFSGIGITTTIKAGGTSTTLFVEISIAPDATPGRRLLTVTTPAGTSQPFDGFTVAGERWLQAAPMLTPRAGHTATALPNGKVLVAGGVTTNGVTTFTAELYDPTTDSWTATGSMTLLPRGGRSILLPSGKVLVFGLVQSGLLSAELHDPSSGLWHPTGSLPLRDPEFPRFNEPILLPDGRVLVFWGLGHAVFAAVYDPETESWIELDVVFPPLNLFTATLLPTGKVLLAGGPTGGPNGSAILFDPIAKTWNRTTSMLVDRRNHSAILLADGTVLVVGGNTGLQNVSSAEIYDPNTTRWSAVGSMRVDRGSPNLTLLSTGEVLAMGGFNTRGGAEIPEIYNPTERLWRLTAPVRWSLGGFRLILLQNRRVLLTGAVIQGEPFRDALLFEPDVSLEAGTDQKFTATLEAGYYTAAVTLPSGQRAGAWSIEVLAGGGVLAGGFNLGGGLDPTRDNPGFAGFLVQGTQTVRATVNAQALPGEPAPRVRLRVLGSDGKQIGDVIQGTTSAVLSQTLSDGFYVAEVSSASGRGTFQLELAADQFTDGVVTGGYIASGVTGFGGFYLPERQQVTIRLYTTVYGAKAAGNLRLLLLDSQGRVISLSDVSN